MDNRLNPAPGFAVPDEHYKRFDIPTTRSMAFVLSAGAPLLAYWFKRRNATPERIASTVWLSAMMLIAICTVGLILSPAVA